MLIVCFWVDETGAMPYLRSFEEYRIYSFWEEVINELSSSSSNMAGWQTRDTYEGLLNSGQCSYRPRPNVWRNQGYLDTFFCFDVSKYIGPLPCNTRACSGGKSHIIPQWLIQARWHFAVRECLFCFPWGIFMQVDCFGLLSFRMQVPKKSMLHSLYAMQHKLLLAYKPVLEQRSNHKKNIFNILFLGI